MKIEAAVYFQDPYGFRSFGPFRGPKADAEAERLRALYPGAAVLVSVVRTAPGGAKTVTRDPFARDW